MKRYLLTLPIILLLFFTAAGCVNRQARSLKKYQNSRAALVVLLPEEITGQLVVDVHVAQSVISRPIAYDADKVREIYITELLGIAEEAANDEDSGREEFGLAECSHPELAADIDRGEYISLLSRRRAVALVDPPEGDEPVLAWQEPEEPPRGGVLLEDEQARVPSPGLGPEIYRIKRRSIKSSGQGLWTGTVLRDGEEKRIYRAIDLDGVRDECGADFAIIVDVLEFQLIHGAGRPDFHYNTRIIVVDLKSRRALLSRELSGSTSGPKSLAGVELYGADSLEAALDGPMERTLDVFAQRFAAATAAQVNLLDPVALESLYALWELEDLTLLENLGPPPAREYQ